MKVAGFKDLCMDAGDALAQARFWATALDAELVDRGDGSARLEVRDPRARVWVDPVPEPRTAKTRVHLDLRLATPEPDVLVAAGASVVRAPGDDPWFVLADPEGNEFCAFPPRDGHRPGVFELVVDARDAPTIAAWWAGVVGGEVRRSEHGTFAWIEGAAGFPWDYWVFTEVPEPKTAKNRVHWDVDLRDLAPTALVAAGATVVREPGGDIRWWVLTDPEGNEFCAFAPES
jgi:Glyoxalase-like domain